MHRKDHFFYPKTWNFFSVCTFVRLVKKYFWYCRVDILVRFISHNRRTDKDNLTKYFDELWSIERLKSISYTTGSVYWLSTNMTWNLLLRRRGEENDQQSEDSTISFTSGISPSWTTAEEELATPVSTSICSSSVVTSWVSLTSAHQLVRSALPCGPNSHLGWLVSSPSEVLSCLGLCPRLYCPAERNNKSQLLLPPGLDLPQSLLSHSCRSLVHWQCQTPGWWNCPAGT